jgi:hypothetical protein
MQAELSMREKKLLINQESEQAKALRNAPASKIAAWLRDLAKKTID